MKLTFDPSSTADYATFLQVKRLPKYRVVGRTVEFPDEYASLIGMVAGVAGETTYRPSAYLFDYQRDITRIAIAKQKFAVFADCGLGKTPIIFEFAQHAAATLPVGKCVLMVSPLMVIGQTLSEAEKFYGDILKIERIAAKDLAVWLESGTARIGITNYDALDDDVPQGRLGALTLDESSMLKSAYGKWGQTCIRLGKGLAWKLALTGTPAPNDRIEYANHAVFLDHFPTVNSFLARFFVNRGQTDNRWELKPHALAPFYRALSHWAIFLTNPATYGWKDNAEGVPPIHVHIEDVALTDEQNSIVRAETGMMFGHNPGGITSRSKLGQIAKGKFKGEDVATLKPAFIRRMVDSWPDESTIIWCHFNAEQELMEQTFPDAASIKGDTPIEHRLNMIEWFCGKICRCELQRRNANTTGPTTSDTRDVGTKEHQNSRENITKHDDANMLQMPDSESELSRKLLNGDYQTPKSVSRKRSRHTASPPQNIEACSNPKVEDAQSVERSNEGCTSITATNQKSSGDSSVPVAISGSGNSQTTQHGLNVQRCTCDKSRGRILISKPRLIGFGLNLQIATRQVFSGLQDSYEEFYQAVKRSNRIGSTRPLNVHIPITSIERPMVETVLTKAHRVQRDAEEQERIFKESARDFLAV